MAAFLTAFLIGAVSLLSQLAIVRELALMFTGNEIFLGLALAGWLGGTALGAGHLSRLRPASQKAGSAVRPAAAALLAGWLPAISLLLIRSARLWLRAPAGLDLGPGPMVLITAAAVMPPAAAGGWWYASLLAVAPKQRPGDLFAAEALGACAAGLLFTFRLAPAWRPWLACAWIGAAACAYAVIVLLAAGRARWLPVPAALGLLLLFQPWEAAERAAEAWLRFPGVPLYSGYTAEGHAALYRDRDQYTAYYFGAGLYSLPEPAAAEPAALLPLLASPDHHRIALFGGGPEILSVLLAQPGVERVWWYAEDAQAQAAWRRAWPQRWRQVYEDPRVVCGFGDGRRELRRSSEPVQVALLALARPETLAANRFFTVEFFRLLRSRLAADGVAVYALPYSPNRLAPDERRLLASVWSSLGRVFPERAVIAGDRLYLLASNRSLQTAGPAALAAAFLPGRFRAATVTPSLLPLLWDARRSAELRRELDAAPGRLNTDRRPLAAGLQSRLWLSQHAAAAVGTAAVLAGCALWAARRRRRPPVPGLSVIAAAGAAGLMLELMIVTAFQTARGNLWQELGLLFAAYMAGTAAGGRLGGLAPSPALRRGWIVGLGLLCLAGPGLIFRTLGSPVAATAVLALGGMCAGGLYGWFGRKWNQEQAAAGWASDLAGGLAGALTVNTLLLPWLGPWAGLVPAGVLWWAEFGRKP